MAVSSQLRKCVFFDVSILTMTGRKLGLLVVFPPQFITDSVEQLHVALLRILGQRSDEGLMISLCITTRLRTHV